MTPKKKAKQIKCYCGHTTYCDCGPLEEPRKETLEEAAEKFATDCTLISDSAAFKGFIEGAKWQSDQDQEDINQLISIIEWYDNESDVRPDVEIFMWFEQFKKKEL